jgi:hypothetical protein
MRINCSVAKTRVQISINQNLVEIGKNLAKTENFDSFSEYLEHLIRDAWRRRQAPPIEPPRLEETPANYRSKPKAK